MKRLRKPLVVFSCIVLTFIAAFGYMFISMGKQIGSIKYYEVSPQDVSDGVYQGSASTSLVKVEVEVEVADHKIVRIDILKHDNGLGSKAEVITEQMISQNSYDVDIISGATMSSNVIKSAVSDALEKGR